MAGRFVSRFRVGWEAYAWLIYSIPFLLFAFDPNQTTGDRWAMVASFPVFLWLYVSAYRMRGFGVLWVVLAFDAIAVAFSSRNPAAGCFFIYGAAALGPALPARQASLVLAAQVVAGAIAAAVLDVPPWYPVMTVAIATLVGAVTIQDAVNRRRNASLRMAQAEVQRLAQVAERARIARDLHDLLGHTLSVVVLKSELAQKLVSRDAARAEQEMADVERIARDGLAEVRQAITGYRSTGLAAEIEHVRRSLASAGIDATIEAPALALDEARETTLSFALREAATNVIRHAGATRCDVRFDARDGAVLMEVSDNGRGGDAPFGNGLTGMRERVQALGGALSRETAGGTRLRIELPD